MKWLDLSLPSPGENLALDDALLLEREAGLGEDLLRLWHSPVHFVAVGYGNKPEMEVNLEACSKFHIPVLRRSTGGGTVLQGPGCFNYSLILAQKEEGSLDVTGTNRWVMERHQKLFQAKLGRSVTVEGATDLTCEGLKFSGNAQRRTKRAILFHGSILLGLDLELVSKTLRFPSRPPDYRGGRSHIKFLMNLPIDRISASEWLREAWGAKEAVAPPPLQQALVLAAERLTDPAWNYSLPR